VSDLFVAPATEEALPACFALLPMLADPDAIVFAARDGEGSLAGAAGLTWRSWNSPPGFPVWVHVLPDRRRQGLGRALLAELIRQGEGELDQLWAAQPIAEASDAAAFARACGFKPERRQLFFEADARTFLTQIARTVDLLRRRGRVPEEAKLVRIDQVAIDDLAHLIASEFRTAPPRLLEMLRRSVASEPSRAPIDRLQSRVLLMDGQVAGALLSRRTGENSAHIVCNVVAPAWRKGWANAALLDGFTRGTVEAGCTRIGFDCGEDVHDTIGLAARSEADHIRTDAWFGYALSATER